MFIRQRRRIVGLLMGVALVAAACGGDGAAGGGTVTIDAPSPGTQVTSGSSVTIQVTATDAAGVARIDLQIDGQVVASESNPSGATPFVAVQTVSVANADTTVVAVAYRADGTAIGSAQLALDVTGPGEPGTEGDPAGGGNGSGDATEPTTGTPSGGTHGGGGDSAPSGNVSDTTTATGGGGDGQTATTTTAAVAATSTTAGAQQAPPDGGSGQAPTEYEIYVEAKNTNPTNVIFEEVISNPGDRGDGLKIIVTNLFAGASQDAATVTLQIQCTPGGPRVRTVSSTNYGVGSACDFLYQTTFDVTYQSYTRNYYIVVPDEVTGYFEYTVIVSAQRH